MKIGTPLNVNHQNRNGILSNYQGRQRNRGRIKEKNKAQGVIKFSKIQDIKEWDRACERFKLVDLYARASVIADKIKFDYLLEIMRKKQVSQLSLEVGCGSARMSVWLATLGFKTVIIDYSKEALELARINFARYGVKGHTVLGDSYCLPFQEGMFDIVLSTGLLEHYKNPLPIIQEMIKALKPKGLFYSDIHSKKYHPITLVNRLLSRSKISEENWDKRDIYIFLVKTNLKEIYVRSMGVIPLLRFPNKLNLLNKAYISLLNDLIPFWKYLDKTILSDVLGYYYFCYGYKEK